ncbi:hypothetical protein LVB77_20630 [Lysobacter sp. 5GHs7-4]|uniref:DMP19 family protein n=1 Tax=Lysobacter sp. 5GHs7-4 TaxID=2904253 RepID=UPI001E53730C|nr:hypothetical protein [Lysobacter sp. 5GHs7-4]UHQ23020.1 hypothetical protein LVB77_20630 [Lysobacter sp. 5GHs7-4]
MHTDDFDFVQSIYNGGLAQKAGELGVAALSTPERSVVLALWAKGILDNGGFAYLHEAGADIRVIRDAFAEVGLDEASRACDLSVIALEAPRREQLPANVTRIDRIDDGEERWSECDKMIWRLGDRFDSAVASYIRRNKAIFGV